MREDAETEGSTASRHEFLSWNGSDELITLSDVYATDKIDEV